MALTIYGSASSRSLRVLWMATELGLDFEHVPYEFDDPALGQPAFRALNPAGTIPTIVDDGFALSESLAINLYLARHYGREGPEPLYPDSPQHEAELLRWSLWAQGHLEPWVQGDALLAELIEAIGAHADAMIDRSLSLLDRVLSERAWLVGDAFSVGDLNVAAVLSPSRSGRLDWSDHPAAERWLAACYARPACRAARERFPPTRRSRARG